MSLRLGILGVGHLAGYLVEGFRRSEQRLEIVLSPRNPERAAALAGRFRAGIARDNREVVERSDIVIVSTRPDQAVDALRGLPWRVRQVLVSVAAGVRLDSLTAVSAPADAVRAMPVSCSAIGESPTPIFPEHEMARELLSRLGPVLALPDEPSFEAAAVLGAFYAWIYALLDEVEGWARSRGVPPETSRELVARSMRGATGMVLSHPDQSMREMLRYLATPGGLTEHGLRVFRESGALVQWSRACEAVLEKLRSRRGPDRENDVE